MRYLVILVCASYFFLNCKKEKETINYTIEGVVTDVNDNSPLSNAVVTISKREVSSGTFNSSYAQITEETTASDGMYSLITKFGSVESFKFEVSKINYFSKELIVNPDDFSTEQSNELNFALTSKGYININIKNSNPCDSLDSFTINSINSNCPNCVKFNSIDLYDVDVDTNLVGGIEANRYFKYQYFVTKNGSTNTFVDSVFCIIGDTTYKSLLY